MSVLIAIMLAILSFIAAKVGMKLVSRVFGIVAFLVFVSWLASGPGGAIIDWIRDPQVDVPSVEVNP
jgi:hypothetical protein